MSQQHEMEVEVAREIADACLTAPTPLEVYRLALKRLTPLVGASFASVFLRDARDPELLKLVCAHNWPQSTARFLSEVRIREGRGPTGRAVARGRPVEVPDVFADAGLDEWWEPAREMGFVSLIALPLGHAERPLGAVSFYFGERRDFDEDDRALLRVVAHQLGATAERTDLLTGMEASDSARERATEEH